MKNRFDQILSQIDSIGMGKHKDDLLANAEINRATYINHESVGSLMKIGANSDALIVSAGPSLLREKTFERFLSCHQKKKLPLICIDATLIRLLKNGIIPDYCVVLDPHPIRMLRWFGDENSEVNNLKDDYFSRQDLDVDFRNKPPIQSKEDIDLVNKYARFINIVPSVSIHPHLTKRLVEANFKSYFWWTPLVDNPNKKDSITKILYQLSNKNAMNTGGNVGAASWILASFLMNFKKIGVIGMDYAYYEDTNFINTQTYYELRAIARSEEELKNFFKFDSGIGNKVFFQDPTFSWYCQNLKEIVEKSNTIMFNCSEAGLLIGKNIQQMALEDFYKGVK